MSLKLCPFCTSAINRVQTRFSVAYVCLKCNATTHFGSILCAREQDKLFNRRDPEEKLVDRLKKVESALLRLLSAKAEKEANGNSPRYKYLKNGAWEDAQDLMRLTGYTVKAIKLKGKDLEGLSLVTLVAPTIK